VCELPVYRSQPKFFYKRRDKDLGNSSNTYDVSFGCAVREEELDFGMAWVGIYSMALDSIWRETWRTKIGMISLKSGKERPGAKLP
jgi:hypothetical protein